MPWEIWAEPPIVNVSGPGVGNISGTGHCECQAPRSPSQSRVTVRLREHRRLWPDRTLATTEQTETDIVLTATYKCSSTGTQVVFKEGLVEGGRRTKKRGQPE